MNEWQKTAPPNEKIVEVENGDEIIEVMAFYGRDGSLPHWTTADYGKAWPAERFTRWRTVAAQRTRTQALDSAHNESVKNNQYGY